MVTILESKSTACTVVYVDILDQIMPPLEGSFLRPFPEDVLKNLAWWCHGYLESAAEHLLLWADYAVPLVFHPASETVHTLRPVLTLARAAIEGASQAIWILNPEERVECVRRCFALVLQNMDEQTKAADTAESRAELQARRDEMFSVFGLTRRKFVPPKYLEIIRGAAEFLSLGDPAALISPDRIERIWRSVSGAAHGKQWTDFELHDRVEAGDGLYSITPKIDVISEALEAATSLFQGGVILFAIRAGRQDELDTLRQDAIVRLAERATTMTGEPFNLGGFLDREE